MLDRLLLLFGLVRTRGKPVVRMSNLHRAGGLPVSGDMVLILENCSFNE